MDPQGQIFLDGVQLTTDPRTYRPFEWKKRVSVTLVAEVLAESIEHLLSASRTPAAHGGRHVGAAPEGDTQ